MSRWAERIVRHGQWIRAKPVKHPDTLKVGKPFEPIEDGQQTARNRTQSPMAERA